MRQAVQCVRRTARHGPFDEIFANTAVTISFKLYDANNKLLEESPEPIVYLHGGHSGIFPKIEEALNHKKVGDAISVTLEPEDAFGDYDAKLVRMESVSDLPPDVTRRRLSRRRAGRQRSRVARHRHRRRQGGARRQPRARRQAAALRCKVLDVRPATPEEIAHGHVHGPHGHHH